MPRDESKPKASIGTIPGVRIDLKVDGMERSAYFYLPKKNLLSKFPLVMVLHGGLGNAENVARMTGMNLKAEQEGFAVCYPNGSGDVGASAFTWNAWNCCGYANEHAIDDVAFMRQLVHFLETNYPIDPTKIFLTGFSNGAMLCHKIAVQLGDKIAAIAPVAGALNATPQPIGPAVPVLMIHGLDDLHVQIAGGIPKRTFAPSQRVDKPLSHAIQYWVSRNQCAKQPEKQSLGRMQRDIYTGSGNRNLVEVCLIEGQGHSWPGSQQGLHYGNIDAPVQDVVATDLIWKFFKGLIDS